MNFDLTPQLPATFDLTHIVLAAIVLILFIACLVRPSKGKVADAKNADANKADAKTNKGSADDSSSIGTDTEANKTASSAVSSVKESSPESALQFLALLQQEARLVDFVQEDIGAYSDEEVGAAARIVHEGSKKAINEYFTLSPIRTEDEGSRITLAEGFNASEVRLTGNVVGTAPFTGTLVHRGWRVTAVNLPKLSAGHDTTIITAAEVEL